MARNVALKILRGVAANIPILEDGEFYLATDTNIVYVGNSGTNVPIGTSSGTDGNSAQAIIDFGTFTGSVEETSASTVLSTPWVTAESKLFLSIVEGQDHTVDEIIAEQVLASVGNIVSGVSVEIIIYAPSGSTGKYLVNIEG